MLKLDLQYNNVETLLNSCNIVGVDKLAFAMDKKDVPELKLKGTKSWIDEETGEITYSRGSLFDIQIYSRSNYLVFEFNPAILLFGNNFQTVTYKEFVEMIYDIEDKLGFSIQNAGVNKIHIQSTLTVDKKPQTYFNVLGNSPRHIRSLHKSTLYYETGSRKQYKTNMFYDKKVQSRMKYLEGEYLRFECQYYNEYLKYFARKIGKNRITIKDLLNPEIYLLFVDLWCNEYLNIEKENDRFFNLDLINTLTDIDKMLINKGLESLGGVTEFEKQLNISKQFSDKKSDFFSKAKSRFRKISKLPSITLEGKLLSELNSKIEIAYQNTILHVINN